MIVYLYDQFNLQQDAEALLPSINDGTNERQHDL